jgi:hypothetical protein
MSIPEFDVLAGIEGKEVSSQEFNGHVLADIDGDGRQEIIVAGCSASGPPDLQGERIRLN